MASVCRLLTRSRVQLPTFLNARRFSHLVDNPSRKVQVYTSASRDPWLNLSIEHFLLQKSPPESVVLFLYTNRPCVVIGRNQNPWLEVNLGLINRRGLLADPNEAVSLVRRRSGGGTVFHDHGNINYSVICPPAAFDRNKHAEMVVRALQNLGRKTVRVNERHDIVIDVPEEAGQATYKISGSAYKLTRLRSLHHGTCLLGTPNIDRIGQFLRSPAAPYITAQGVESVRSKIKNVGIDNSDFESAAIAEFGGMYGDVQAHVISEAEARENKDIMKGYDEITDEKWTFEQTPRFIFSTHPTERFEKVPPPLPDHLEDHFEAFIEARHGEILTGEIDGLFPPNALDGSHLHKINDWRIYREGREGEWLNELFGVRLDTKA
ncbi:hypothetical protein JX266_003221 [Neoarthrinium moseri]|uniref:uncharacterized protein n=1 Tax=Neoarthrinium moseri TaxID=1658444 RepID=UPI001FDD6F09|nr:uncharacterized protein JN550_009642 [Neoarthrinium moseri]KAI1851759.1 hypothetical protein JX266_003221 [Neoarthrinium moseri]KAI1863322.1 hypothetical protein JN550_009642 [Neoarthrinium moseri]